MIKQERQKIIVDAVNEHKYVSLGDLITLTGASESSIRADLIELAGEEKLIRLRGGAEAINNESLSYELNVETKMGIEVEAKKKIAAYAASLVKDDSVIYIDAGTSTYYLAEALSARRVKIVTNSISIARKLKARDYETFVIGGEFKLTTDAFIGTMTREIIAKFIFDMGFFGTNGIDIRQGCTTPDYEEAVVKRAAMAQCNKVYVLADHTKFDVRTTVSFHPFVPEEIITDYINKKDFENKGIKEVGK
ncbi:MAG: DeoR/GlpR family DNA-binding transcription regulator [Bacilli bacterium]|nr:DeoR/GlpR family DNA-binding transcription regulator [Bacilli bacterium]